MYDWAAMEAICRRMVTVEGKTQDEMLEVLKVQNFTPRYTFSAPFLTPYSRDDVDVCDCASKHGGCCSSLLGSISLLITSGARDLSHDHIAI